MIAETSRRSAATGDCNASTSSMLAVDLQIQLVDRVVVVDHRLCLRVVVLHERLDRPLDRRARQLAHASAGPSRSARATRGTSSRLIRTSP